jgi:hypothetical protein
MKTILSLIISAALVVSGYSQTRNVLVGTNNAVVQPTNFWSVDASNARAGLGLGSAATNLSSAFQPSSATLSNLASSNAINLTNIRATNLVGLIPSSNIPTTLTNITGTLSITQGGTGATNSSGARASLELGTAATNPSTAFQAASSALTNLAANNGANLTNIPLSGVVNALASNGNAINLTNLTAANITGTVALASNITGTIAISNGGSGATTADGARTNLGLGATWLTNTAASNFRAAIGLGWSALTNSNAATSLLGYNTTNFSIVYSGGQALVWTSSVGVIFSNEITFRDSSGNNAAVSGAGIVFGSTNPSPIATVFGFEDAGADALRAIARTNLGLGFSVLTNTNTTNFKTDIGLGATNNSFSALSVGINITNDSTASNASSAFGNQITIDSTVENSLAVGFGHSMSNFGNQAGGSVLLGGIGTMTNWGAFLFNGVPQGGTSAVSRGNSTFAVNASNGIYLNGPIILEFEQGVGTGQGLLSLGAGGGVEKVATNVFTATPAFVGWSGFAYTAFDAGTARTNIGLPWTGLTNTNAATFQTALFGSNTNPVLVDTNGSVVSPTNFWQVAPIQTLVQDLTVIVTSQTNNATNARNLYIYSLATNVSGISNTIILPTNAATLAGDEVTVIHMGNTNTTTVIRQAGSTNNLITLSKFDEAVKFIRETGQWDFYHNISYVEAIQFSGTNASNNIAATRTNLGLGLPALTNSNTTNFQAAVFQTNTTPAGAAFNNHVAWMEVNVITNGSNTSFRIPLFK